jgi:hypothetical protein
MLPLPRSRAPVVGMTGGYASAFSRRHSPEFCKFIRPKKIEGAARPSKGRREDRVRAAPAVPCAKVDRKRTRAYRFSGNTPAFPAQWFTAYSVLSPVRPELVCHRHPQEALAPCELDTCHWGVRTTRLRRPLQPRSSVATFASIASHRTFVTIASRPSHRVGWPIEQLIWVKRKAKYFCGRGWTQHRVICPPGTHFIQRDERNCVHP